MRRALPLLLASLSLLLGAAGCGPKKERLLRVATEDAPLWNEPEEDEPPTQLLHAGDLVSVLRPLRPLHWKGQIEGRDATREGEVLEVRRASQDGAGYLFRSDLAGEVEVPNAEWICQRIGGTAQCAGRLRRIVIPDGLLAYEACYTGPCAVGVVRGREVQSLPVDGLAELRFIVMNGEPAAVATTRWMKSPQLTGGSLLVLRLRPRLARGIEVTLDQVDTSHNTLRTRQGKATVSAEGIRFKGQEKVAMPNGVALSTKDVDETYRLAPAPK